MAPEVFI